MSWCQSAYNLRITLACLSCVCNSCYIGDLFFLPGISVAVSVVVVCILLAIPILYVCCKLIETLGIWLPQITPIWVFRSHKRRNVCVKLPCPHAHAQQLFSRDWEIRSLRTIAMTSFYLPALANREEVCYTLFRYEKCYSTTTWARCWYVFVQGFTCGGGVSRKLQHRDNLFFKSMQF